MLFIAADHGGYQLKKYLIDYLKNELKEKIKDFGPTKFDPQDDYPDFVIPMVKAVIKNNNARGIAICRNGVGVCITANKIKGARAGIGYNISAAKTMRTDDDTNILCLAGDFISNEHATAILKTWLETPADLHPRHVRRRKKVADLEK